MEEGNFKTFETNIAISKCIWLMKQFSLRCCLKVETARMRRSSCERLFQAQDRLQQMNGDN